MSEYRFVPGNVYDQDHPELYVKPQWFSIDEWSPPMGDSVRPPVSVDSVQPNWLIRKISRLGVLVLTCTLTLPTLVDAAYVARDISRECPEASPEPVSDNIDIIRQSVANMEFGLNRQDYELLREEILATMSVDEVKAILNSVTKKFDIDVNFLALPKKSIGLFEFDDPSTSHDPDALTLSMAQVGANKFLKGLGRIPASLLQKIGGTDIFLVAHFVNNGKRIKGLFLPQIRWRQKAAIVINIPDDIGGARVDVESNLWHELAHRLQDEQCGSGDGGRTTGINKSNPPGFRYNSDEATRSEYVKKGYVITSYAAESLGEDIAETTEGLFKGNINDDDSKSRPVVRQKAGRVIDMLSSIEPNIADYFAYLDFIGPKDFLGDYARAELDFDVAPHIYGIYVNRLIT